MIRILLKTIFLFMPGMIWGSCSSGEKAETAAGLTLQRVTTYTLAASGGEVGITCSSALPVTARSNQSWLTLTDQTQQGHTRTFTFGAAANGGAAREATVTLTSGSEELSVTVSQQRRYDQPSLPSNDATRLAVALSPGWNLGNQLDAHNNGVASETAWGNMAATQTLFNQLKRQGFKSVRIPVTWLGKTGDAPDYVLDGKWLDRVEQVVGYAGKCGMNAIINIHHDGYGSQYWLNIKRAATDAAYNKEVKARLGAVWRQIAERFIETDDFLIFELLNEIQDGGWGNGENRNDGGKQYAVLNEWNQLAVDVVRATGGKNATRYLAVAGYSANPELTMAHLECTVMTLRSLHSMPGIPNGAIRATRPKRRRGAMRSLSAACVPICMRSMCRRIFPSISVSSDACTGHSRGPRVSANTTSNISARRPARMALRCSTGTTAMRARERSALACLTIRPASSSTTERRLSTRW